MIIDTITPNTYPLYYSRWHSVSTPEKGRHYDINVGGLVGPILEYSEGLFIVCVFLTELIQLDDNYETNADGYKIWNISAGTLYLEDLNGIRYLGAIETFIDTDEGLKPHGSYCVFTSDLDTAYVESFFKIIELIPISEHRLDDKDYSDAINFVKHYQPIIKDFCPERFI